MRRTLCVGQHHLLKYRGNPQAALNEDQLIRRLKEDDMFRAEMGQPVWMNVTKANLERIAEEEGEELTVRPEYEHKRLLKQRRGPPVDYGDLDGHGLSEVLLRKLKGQGIDQFTDIQKQLFKGLRQENDIFAASYTGSGKSFGLALILADRMLSQPPTLPFSYIAILPTTQLALQFEKWLLLFCGDVSVGTMLGDDPLENERIFENSKPYILIATFAALTATFQHRGRERRKRNKNGQGEKLLGQLIKQNSQLLCFDEADVYQTEAGKDLLRRLIRIRGGKASAHAIPQQQCIFISATLGASTMSDLRKFVRTSFIKRESGSYVGEHGSDLSRTQRSEPHKILTYERKSFKFPPNLHHGFAAVETTSDILTVIGRVMKAYPEAGYCVRGLILTPGFKRRTDIMNESRFPVAKGLVFTSDHQVHKICDCLNASLPYPAVPFTGNAVELAAARLFFDSHPEPCLLVLPQSSVRGLDFLEATHVFVIGMPDSTASYTHLSGRTARNFRVGASITMLRKHELAAMRKQLIDMVHVVATNPEDIMP